MEYNINQKADCLKAAIEITRARASSAEVFLPAQLLQETYEKICELLKDSQS